MVRERSEICLSYLVVNGEKGSEVKGAEGRGQFYQIVRLSYFVGRLFQPPLRRIDPPITLINVFLHIAHVIIFKSILAFVRGALVLSF